MKRKELLRYLRSHECDQIREGKRYSWWYNPKLNRRSSIPRHVEINDVLARKICKDLGMPPIK